MKKIMKKFTLCVLVCTFLLGTTVSSFAEITKTTQNYNTKIVEYTYNYNEVSGYAKSNTKSIRDFYSGVQKTMKQKNYKKVRVNLIFKRMAIFDGFPGKDGYEWMPLRTELVGYSK